MFKRRSERPSSETRFRPSVGQVTLAGWALIVLAGLTISTFDASRTAFQQASVLRQAESPAATLIFTQREALVYATRLGEWLGGNIPRREVQISRALLAQRLNVVSGDGTTAGQRADPTFLSALRSLDTIVDKSPPGVLAEIIQHQKFDEARPYLDQFIASARDLVVQYQQAIDIQLNKDAKDRADSSQRNLFLLYALVILAGVLLSWLGYSILRQYRLAKLQIALDTKILEESQNQLEELTEVLEAKRARDLAEFEAREQMRNSAREISLAIREIENDLEMTSSFCQKTADLFGSDFASVATFPDGRVPHIQTSWTHAAGLVVPEEFANDSYRQVIAQTIENLWTESSSLVVYKDRIVESFPNGDETAIRAFEAMFAASGFSVMALQPMGEGEKAFGFFSLAYANDTDLDEYSRQTLQFLSTHLAYSLIENQLLATQAVVEQLEALNDAKNDFISTVNHELRTPLTSIIGYIDLLKEMPSDAFNGQAAKFLETLDRNALALLDLVESMLSLSRLDTTEHAVSFQNVDMVELLERVKFVLEPTSASKGLELVFHVEGDENEFLVSGDAGQLSQVFINLVSNAIKFSDARQTVTMSLSHKSTKRGEQTVVSVLDQGIGIAKEDIPKLFTRFFRGQNAMDEQIPGTGLGLAIVQKILTLHGGTIEVDSTLGSGTTMTVTLPAVTSRVESLIAARRVGVLERAIIAVDQATSETLYSVAHEMAGAIGMYTFVEEGEQLRDFSHWLKANPSAEQSEVEGRRDAILQLLRQRFEVVQAEGAK